MAVCYSGVKAILFMSSISESALANGAFPMKIGNVEYQASRFSDRDWADINEYVRSKYLSNMFEACKNLSSEMQADLKKTALSQLPQIHYDTDEGRNIIFSLDGNGIFHLGFQMIKKRHPKVTYEDFEKECRVDGKTATTKIMETYDYLMSPPEGIDANGGASTENKKSE